MLIVVLSDMLLVDDDVDDIDDDFFVDKCANEDFVNFGSVVVVGDGLLPFVTPK